eukprot:1408488-Prymnesium_polylepis.1
MVGPHAIFASHSSRLHLSLRLPAARPRRPRESMALSLAENRGRCVPPTSRSLRSPFPKSCPYSSCSPVGLQRIGRTLATRVQDEQMVHQSAPA